MYNDCYSMCGVDHSKCKNKYCSANLNYSPPVVKQKVKQGAGKPTHSKRASIPKYNPSMFNYFSE